ncbi:MAG TPA: zinc-dependent alcohol dehydrogenase family protein [Actinocrinis sp.]|nr:zinc-dependent alcohol dehydrogenase family protein [Actinocrinis sp.]
MRAVVLEEFGGAMGVVEVAQPEAGPGEVLVRVQASGINPLDLKIRSGNAAHAKSRLPAVLGLDLAGVVVDVGPGVENFVAGDEVYGLTGGVGQLQGSMAQYAAVDARLLALKPRSLSMTSAAALPLVAITAWEGLVDRADVSAGDKVLVHGGAGGIGHVAVQLARARGAEVFATGSAANLETIRGFGATPIDYAETTVAEYVAQYTGGEGFDVVFDTVGGAVLDASFTAVREYTGHVVSALGWGSHSLAPLSFRGASYSGVFTLLPMLSGRGREHHGEILAQVAALVDAGHITPLVHEKVFGLDEFDAAYAVVEQGRAGGKVIIGVEH